MKLVYFLVRRKIAAAGGCHSFTHRRTLVIGQTILPATPRFNFAGNAGEFLLILFGPGLDLLQQCSCFELHEF